MGLTVLNVLAKQDIGEPSAKIELRYKKVGMHPLRATNKEPKSIYIKDMTLCYFPLLHRMPNIE